MSIEPPIDLRSLANVEAPEVSKDALRRFRRRLLVRFVWLAFALALISIAAVYVAQARHNDIATIDNAQSPWRPTSYQVGPAHLVVLRAVLIGSDIGLHFVVSDPTAQPDACLETEVLGIPVDQIVNRSMRCGGPIGENWIVVPKPPAGTLRVRVRVTPKGGQPTASPTTPRAVLGDVTIDVREVGAIDG